MDKQLDSKELLEKLLNACKDLAEKGKEKGQTLAENTLNIPESGEAREQMLDGLKKGALATAVVVGLLGTKGGRSLTGKAMKIGGLAALGTAAFKGYKRWQASNIETAPAPIHELNGAAQQERALLMITAMVAAANADGKIDDEESAKLKHEILNLNLPQNLFETVTAIIESPLTAKQLAEKVNNIEESSEVYLAVRIFIDGESSSKEVAFLTDLVTELEMDQDLILELDKQIS